MTSALFYIGILVSSVGSFTYTICLVAFLARSGFDLWHVSFILGAQRMVPVLISTMIGHRTDELSPKATVIVSEVLAAAATLGILWAWMHGKEGYWALAAFTILKTSIVTFQAGSRAKLTKLLSDNSYASNSHNAIWFNKATQGATLFAGLFAWPIIQFFGFEVAIWFDLVTFLVNGLIVWSIEFQGERAASAAPSTQSMLTKFKDFYHYNGRTAVLDLLLAVSMMGTTSFTARIAGDDKTWVAVLVASYGAAVWISGSLERMKFLESRSLVFWAGLGSSYALLGLFPGLGGFTLGLALLKDTFYWLLLHRTSTHIQMDTPQNVMGSVTSARMTQMILVLASGEFLVGGWSTSVPVMFDGLWRAGFCFAVLTVLASPRFRGEVKYGYAKL